MKNRRSQITHRQMKKSTTGQFIMLYSVLFEILA